MNSETYKNSVSKEKQNQASSISGGVFLISLGILLWTGWWWPGIMIAIGLASGAEFIFRGQTARGLGSLLFFCSIPVIVWLIQVISIPWTLIGPMILIGTGIIILVKTSLLRPA